MHGRFYGTNANTAMRNADWPYLKAVQQAYWLSLIRIYTAWPKAEWLQPLTSFVGIEVHALNFGAHVHMTKHAVFPATVQAFRNRF